MRRVLRWAPAAALALLVAPELGAQQPAPLEVLEAAAARYKDVRTLCAGFDQTLTVPLLHQENKGSGRLCQALPNRFAMRFDDPAGDAVVIDGTWVWLYYKSQDPKTVLRVPLADAPGGFDFHREFLEKPAEKYNATLEGSERIDGHVTWRIGLVPRKPTSYRRAVVWIDAQDHLLRRMQVQEENESVRTVTLSGIELNAKPPSGWFTFTPPPGTQVISR